MSKQLSEYSRYDKARLSTDFPSVPDWVFGAFVANKGKTVAVACDKSTTDGGILLTDRISEARAPDVAVVVACEGTPYDPGDCVAFVYGYSTRVKDFTLGENTLTHEIRFYGSYGESMDNGTNETTVAPRDVPWEDYALMVYKEAEWKPLPGKVALEIPEAETKVGSLYIPDDAQRDPLTAVVYSVSEGSRFSPGQEVVYHAPAAQRVDERRIVIKEEHVYTVVR